ncbi:hypothetical protein WA026_010352 [Henosepilachna vigintioctopunctata]|uniref:MCM N-terminal domain-containing protein n=1 Tax=Henosepilachna vigintioctopunctata TaxID=420089 RepID=A0AAW1V4S1_9CUCU
MPPPSTTNGDEPSNPRRSRRLGSETFRSSSTRSQAGTPRATPAKGSRTPRHGSQTPRHGSQTPAREEFPETPLLEGNRTPRRTPAHNSDVELTPMSLAPTSPGMGLMSEIDLSSPLNYGTPSSLGSIRTPRSGIRGTPVRMRPDVRSDKRIRQVNVGDLDTIPEANQEINSTTPHLVIWGTNVSLVESKKKFKQFILRFIDPNAEEDERTDDMSVNEPLYMQKLDEIHTLEEPFLNVNCLHKETFDATLYKQLVCYPQEVIPTFDISDTGSSL